MTDVDLRGLRVLHVVPGYTPAQGGIETLVDGLGPQLRADLGIESSILAPRRWRERPDGFVSHGMPVESVDIPNDHSGETTVQPIVRMFAGVRRAIECQAPDVIHSHGIGHLLVATVRVARSMGLPIVFHIHGNIHAEILESQARVLREAGVIIAVSQPAADSVRDVIGFHGDLRVIDNGIPQPTKAWEHLRSNRIVMVGRFESNKGFDHGFAAVARLIVDIPDVEVTVVGVGEALIELQDVAHGLGIADRVHFVGRCSRERTRELMAQSSVVLIPSLTIEGFSLVAAEAAFLGVPVVAYRTGGLSSTVIDGESGLLVDTGDIDGLATALQRVLRDPELALRLSAGAQHHAEAAFSIRSFAQRIAGVYADAAGDTWRVRQ